MCGWGCLGLWMPSRVRILLPTKSVIFTLKRALQILQVFAIARAQSYLKTGSAGKRGCFIVWEINDFNN